MFGLNRNTWLLVLVQPFALAISPAIVFVSGFIGKNIAPNPKLATLPLSFLVIGITLGTVPAALLMQRFGRKAIFISAMFICAISSLLASWSISQSNFILFLIAMSGAGTSLAVVQQFRFAAVEGAHRPELASRAISTLMLGSIAAAFIGTELAASGKDFLTTPYAGSFIYLAAASLIAAFLLIFFKNPDNTGQPTEEHNPVDWSNILRRPNLWIAMLSAAIGYGVMSFVMTATPLAMHDMSMHSLADTKWVIQSHIMAMFLPSLVTGELIRKLGVMTIIWTGLGAFIGTSYFAFSGAEVFHYWWALVFLGIGWNFLFIGGTTLLTQSYQPNEKYKVQAVNDFSVFVLQAVASLGAGAILFIGGWHAIVVTSLIPTISLGLILLAFAVNKRRRQKP